MTQAVTLASIANSGYARNRIINGNMVIDQRNAGAAVTVNTGNQAFTVDRFYGQAQGGGAFTLQQSSTAPEGFINSIIATVTTADTSLAATDFYVIKQRIEGLNVADLNWGTANAKTVTLSFWVRSSISGAYTGALLNSAENRAYPFSYTINSTNTFEYKTITIAGDTTGTWLSNSGVGIALGFALGAGSTYLGTAGVWAASRFEAATGQTQWISTNGATFYLTGAQFEVGTQATPYEWQGYPQQLVACQRYYSVATTRFRSDPFPSGTFGVTGSFPVIMRASPTVTTTTNLGTLGTTIVNDSSSCFFEFTGSTFGNVGVTYRASAEL